MIDSSTTNVANMRYAFMSSAYLLTIKKNSYVGRRSL